MYCTNPACKSFGVWENTTVVSHGARGEARKYLCTACGSTFLDRYRVYVAPRVEKSRAKECRKHDKNGNVWCVCPMCEREHWAVIFWTGRGQPRRFCKSCRWHMSERESMQYDETVYTIADQAAREAVGWM